MMNQSVAAPLHPLEKRRLKSLNDTGLLDTSPSQRFDSITRATAKIFNVPIALVSLVDTNRQWFLSNCGLMAKETPREDAFCAHAILENDLLVVEDTECDIRFKHNRLVVNEPNIRFYAGAVIHCENGLPLGTLCIIDDKPRKFTYKQRTILLEMAKIVSDEITTPFEQVVDRITGMLSAKKDPITNAYLGEEFFNQIKQRDSIQLISHNQYLCLIDLVNLDEIHLVYGEKEYNSFLLQLMKTLRTNLQGLGDHLFGRQDRDKILIATTLQRNVDIDTLYNTIYTSLVKSVAKVQSAFSPKYKFGLTTVSHKHNILEEYKLLFLSLKYIVQECNIAGSIIDNELKEKVLSNVALALDLKNAIEQNELSLAYQPKMSTEDDACNGLEALLRWRHQTHGDIPPSTIIAKATEVQLLFELEKWIFCRVHQQIAQWKKEGIDVPRISINITGETLLNPYFSLFILELFENSEVSMDNIDIEIVESALIENLPKTALVMNTLRKHNVTFSLDDFGTGYSSLSYLKDLPFNNLKIDKSFVDKIVSERTDSKLCNSLVSLAKSLDLGVIAEGIENKNQAILLKALGCDSLQGYYFHKPIDCDNVSQLLKKKKQDPD